MKVQSEGSLPSPLFQFQSHNVQSFKDSKLVSRALANLVAAARTMQCEIKVMIRIKKRFTNLIYRTSTLSQ